MHAALVVDSSMVPERSFDERFAAAMAGLPFGWFWHAKPWLRLLDAFRPGLVVELGSYNGASAIATARLLAGWGGSLVCVDTWADGPAGPPHRLDAFQRNLETAGIGNVDTVVSTTTEAARAWTYGLVDAIYVDADHTAASVTADLVAWWPWLRTGGVIGGDDYDNPEYPGVAIAWGRFGAQTGVQIMTTHHEQAKFPLVWTVKDADTRVYVPMVDPPRERGDRRYLTTCSVCHRCIWSDHVDDRGRCCFCAGD